MAAFDFDTLTLGEVATIEDLSGVPIGTLGQGTPQGKFLAALVMVAKRRSGQPGYTFNQAMSMTVEEAQQFLGLTGDDTDDLEDSPEGKGAHFDANVTG